MHKEIGVENPVADPRLVNFMHMFSMLRYNLTRNSRGNYSIELLHHADLEFWQRIVPY